MARNKKSTEPELQFPIREWPEQNDFPLNLKPEHRKVKSILERELETNKKFLMVTGFTSLSQIIETFGKDDSKVKGTMQGVDGQIRILLGFEPIVYKRKKWKQVSLDQEIFDFWLDKGISPLRSGEVLKVISLIEERRLDFRILDTCHAKIYLGDGNAILGSSNFSYNGLNDQIEANIRVKSVGSNYLWGVRKIAENYWEMGTNYNDRIIQLFKELLLVVDWQEALSKAIADILESSWLKNYPDLKEFLNDQSLWPSQMSGLSQAIHILRDQGSVLVADPTGSGKTKMIVTLQMALVHWLWESGRKKIGNPLVVCPPLVIPNWKREQLDIRQLVADPISEGELSHALKHNKSNVRKSLHIADILVLDEAHNYLNPTSNRSEVLKDHMADYTILSTATPINKKAEDLLRLIELLNPENLNDDELAVYKELRKGRPIRDHRDNSLEQLRRFIWRFTLRRTKRQFNEMIDRQPERFVNRLGESCRFPNKKDDVYSTGETDQDRRIASEISQLAAQLKGVSILTSINRPEWPPLNTPEQIQGYINSRLKGAIGLSIFRVQSALRSSRAALIELIFGTPTAAKEFELSNIKKNTGNIIETVKNLMGSLPLSDFDPIYLPEWMKNIDLYQKACEEEIAIYNSIAAKVRKISDSRESTKVAQIVKAVKKYGLVLAFDRTIISLHYFKKLVTNQYVDIQTRLATGDGVDKEKVINEFSLGSDSKNCVALCSDSMSEGVNLQQAQAVILLDIPSVLRLAEQRIGRIERLDSPHKEIHVFWPDDSTEFQLKTDKKLFFTSQVTEQVLGSNLDLPEEFISRYGNLETLSVGEIIRHRTTEENEEKEWEGVRDAFYEVRQLIEGDHALIPINLYDKLKTTNASVRCKVSFVSGNGDWAFFSLRGTNEFQSRWIFIDNSDQIFTDYSTICQILREKLIGVQSEKLHMTDLTRYFSSLRLNERKTLSNRRRRALNVAEHLLNKQHKYYQSNPSSASEILNKVRGLFVKYEGDVVLDQQAFADVWLNLLAPSLKAKREKNPRGFFTLDDLKSNKKCEYFNLDQLRQLLDEVPLLEAPDLQVSACIIGVKTY